MARHGLRSALALLTFGMFASIHGQTVVGTVLDETTAAPIANAEVTVLDTNGVSLDQLITDSAGGFQVVLEPGDYVFRVLRIGHTPIVTTVLHHSGGTNDIGVIVRIPAGTDLEGDEPYALAPIVVEAPPANRYLSSFIRHQSQGQGDFAQRTEFERWQPRQITDVVRRMRGFSILGNPNYGSLLPGGSVIDTRPFIIDVHGRSHTAGQRECPPHIFVDGVNMGSSQYFDINTLPIDALEAVEAYARPIQTPAEFLMPGNDCGVIAFWTRTGSPGEAGSPFEVGIRYGGALAGEAFSGGRLGIHLVTPFLGPFEFFPAMYPVSSAFSNVYVPENSSWMIQLAVRTTVERAPIPFYAGTGLVLVKRDAALRVSVYDVDIDPRYTAFLGFDRELGIARPFVELHLLDFFTPSNISSQIYMGLGFQF